MLVSQKNTRKREFQFSSFNWFLETHFDSLPRAVILHVVCVLVPEQLLLHLPDQHLVFSREGSEH